MTLRSCGCCGNRIPDIGAEFHCVTCLSGKCGWQTNLSPDKTKWLMLYDKLSQLPRKDDKTLIDFYKKEVLTK